jgi:hypothetical protein
VLQQIYADILLSLNKWMKGLGAIRAKIGPTSNVGKIFSKMYTNGWICGTCIKEI